MTCKECIHYIPGKEKYIGRCDITDRPMMQGDTCGSAEEDKNEEP